MKLKTNDFDPLGGPEAPGKTKAPEQPKLDGSMIIPARLHEGCILKYEDMAARYGDQREENRRLVDKIAGLDYQDRMKALKVIELQEELQFSKNAEALQAAKLEKLAVQARHMRQALELVLDFHSADTQSFVKKYGHGFTTKRVCDVVREALR